MLECPSLFGYIHSRYWWVKISQTFLNGFKRHLPKNWGRVQLQYLYPSQCVVNNLPFLRMRSCALDVYCQNWGLCRNSPIRNQLYGFISTLISSLFCPWSNAFFTFRSAEIEMCRLATWASSFQTVWSIFGKKIWANMKIGWSSALHLITLALLVIDYICKLEMLLINVLIFTLNYHFKGESLGCKLPCHTSCTSFLSTLLMHFSYLYWPTFEMHRWVPGASKVQDSSSLLNSIKHSQIKVLNMIIVSNRTVLIHTCHVHGS